MPDGGHFGARGVPQSQNEAVLDRWAQSLGANVQRKWELVDLADRGDAVEAVVRTPGGIRRLRGVPGRLRRRAEHGAQGDRFDFPGTPATREMFLADAVSSSQAPGGRSPEY